MFDHFGGTLLERFRADKLVVYRLMTLNRLPAVKSACARPQVSETISGWPEYRSEDKMRAVLLMVVLVLPLAGCQGDRLRETTRPGQGELFTSPSPGSFARLVVSTASM